MSIFPGFLRHSAKPIEINLTEIRIASPCPAEWAKMTGDDRERHCAECNLNVYNLSAMTERQVKSLLVANQGKRLCTRFYRRADGTMLTQDCPWSLRVAARKVSRLATAVLTAVLSINFAAAKSKPKEASCDCQQTQQKDAGLKLTVTDQHGALIPNAEIMLTKNSGKETVIGSTGPSGEWSQSKLAAGQYSVTVKSQGFRSFNSAINVRDGVLLALKVTLPVAVVNTIVKVEVESVALQGEVVTIVQNPITLPINVSGPGTYSPLRR